MRRLFPCSCICYFVIFHFLKIVLYNANVTRYDGVSDVPIPYPTLPYQVIVMMVMSLNARARRWQATASDGKRTGANKNKNKNLNRNIPPAVPQGDAAGEAFTTFRISWHDKQKNRPPKDHHNP